MKNLRNVLTSMCLFVFCSFTMIYANKPSFNKVLVNRIQLKVKTNTIKNAPTDSPVWVKLTSKDNRYYLNNPGNDREKGKTDIYDILSPSISTIGDIKMIELGMAGSDGWNFTEITLVVNGRTIYSKKFSKAGQWIDLGSKKHPGSYKVGTKTLRKSKNWRYNTYTKRIYRTPLTIPLSTMISFVESTVGNSLYNFKEISWGKKYGKDYVEARRINSNTLRFDLDLEYNLKGLPNLEIDVDFDLKFICRNGVIVTRVINYKSKAKGASKYIADQIKGFNDFLLTTCSVAPTSGARKNCRRGLNTIGQLLAFNNDYNGKTNVNLPNACSNQMRLDFKGNLVLNTPNNNGPITGIN